MAKIEDLCRSCKNGSFEKCKTDFDKVKFNNIATQVITSCESYIEKDKHHIKITYERDDGKRAFQEIDIYADALPDLEWESVGLDKKDIDRIIDYLNRKLGTHYRSSSRKTVQLIQARVKDGASLLDFKKVIDNQCRCWKSDEKMSQYLRPSTLFGPHFEEYLNNIPARPKNKLACEPTYDLEKIKADAMNNTDI